jgi:peptidoglycan/LPS O-acetylase OafA/YrhL
MGAFRLILAYFVVLNHTVWYYTLYSLPVGGIAVAAFFFVSGYLMPLAFVSNYKFATFGERIYHYGVNRFLRIYPLYWISLILMIILGLRVIFKDPLAQNAEFYFHPVTYVQNFLLLGLNQEHLWGQFFRFNNPAWTLDVELQYYILVPFLCVGWVKHKKLTGSIIILFSLISAVFLYHRVAITDIDRSFLTWALLFFAGFMYYFTPSFQTFIAESKGFYVGLIIFSIVLFIVTSNAAKALALTLILLLIAARLLVLQKEKRFGRMDALCGDLSYPVYIMHFAVLDVTQSVYMKYLHFNSSEMQVDIKLLLFNIIVTTGVAYTLLRLISDPIESIRNRLKIKNRPA